MYRINTATGDIYETSTGEVSKSPFMDGMYLRYASWIQAGNTAEQFYEEPPAPVPSEVLRFQFRVALLNAEVLPSVENYMATHSGASGIVWKDLDYFNRSSNIVEEIRVFLNQTPEQMDDLFRNATLITA